MLVTLLFKIVFRVMWHKEEKAQSRVKGREGSYHGNTGI